MAPTTLDHMLEAYLDTAVQPAQSVSCCGKVMSYTKFGGEDLTGQGDSKESAVTNLREIIRQKVYRAMNANRSLPILAGIDITPGSC